MSASIYNKLDVDTLRFLIQLKAVNVFWFQALISCAKRDAKTAQKCIDEACKIINYSALKGDNVNVFQICHAANKGLLNFETFNDSVKNTAWLIAQNHVLKNINKDLFK